jgi:periplasmic divalent cation tolerance protein
MEYSLIYITAATKDEAIKIGALLVEHREVACVNIIDGMTSMYWWKGEIARDSEAVIIAKTLSSKTPDVVRRVKDAHSYECPCIVAVPLAGGNPDFLQWIGDSLS